MANTRPIHVKRFPRWRGRGKKIPQNRIQQHWDRIAVATDCAPLELGRDLAACNAPDNTGNIAIVDLVPQSIGQNAAANVYVRSVDVRFHLAVGTDSGDCPEEWPTIVQNSSASLDVRWALVKLRGKQAAEITSATTGGLAASMNMFSTTPIWCTQDELPIIDYGQVTKFPTLSARQYVSFASCDVEFLVPALSTPPTPSGTVFVAGYDNDTHVSFNVRKSFKFPMVLEAGDSLSVLVQSKSWYSSAYRTMLLTTFGTASIRVN